VWERQREWEREWERERERGAGRGEERGVSGSGGWRELERKEVDHTEGGRGGGSGGG
jgi:hypothetical protein